MSDQRQEAALLTEVRGLAPGFVVSFARPLNLKGSGHSSANRTRFPHITAVGLGDATPDLLLFASELSVSDGRTVEAIIDSMVDLAPTRRPRLQRFASAAVEAGYLVPDAPPPRWPDESVPEPSDADAISSTQLFQVPEGTGLLIDGGSFLWFDHRGALRLRLTATEMLIARTFAAALTPDQAWAEMTSDRPTEMTRSSFDDVVRRLRVSGLLRTIDAIEQERTSFEPAATNARDVVLEGVLEAVANFERAASTRPGSRVAVVPVNDDHNMAPLSLGLLLAYAQELDGGRLQDRYDFVPLFLADEDTLRPWIERPTIFLFSNYIWNVERNLKLSASLK